MRDTAGEPYLIYSSSVWIQDVVWKTCRERWMIGTDGERERERGNPCQQRDLMMII